MPPPAIPAPPSTGWKRRATNSSRATPGIRAQNDAVDRLDSARDRLDAATAKPPERLADEKRRKMADTVKGLLERQKAAVAEAESDSRARCRGEDVETPGRDELRRTGTSCETDLAEEVAKLEAEFAPLPVLARVIAETSRR